MAQPLRALAPLQIPDDLFQFPEPYMVAHSYLTPVPGVLMASSDVHEHQTHTMHRQTCRENIPAHRKWG